MKKNSGTWGGTAFGVSYYDDDNSYVGGWGGDGENFIETAQKSNQK